MLQGQGLDRHRESVPIERGIERLAHAGEGGGAPPKLGDREAPRGNVRDVIEELEKRHTALVQLIRRQIPRSLRSTLDAADVLQEVYATLLRQQATLLSSGRGFSQALLLGVARGNIRNEVRRHRRRGDRVQMVALDAEDDRDEEHELISPCPGPDEQLVLADAWDEIRAAIEDLPDNFRAVFKLRILMGETLRETASMLGISAKVASSRLSHAKDILHLKLNRVRGLPD